MKRESKQSCTFFNVCSLEPRFSKGKTVQGMLCTMDPLEIYHLIVHTGSIKTSSLTGLTLKTWYFPNFLKHGPFYRITLAYIS